MVVATQNPIEQQGTYPLPEAQLDRFLFKHRARAIPAREEERAIVAAHGGAPASHDIARWASTAQADRTTLDAALARPSATSRLTDEVVGYIAAWSARTRETADLRGRRLAARRRHAGRAPPAPAPRSTAATMSSPTTSRRWPCRRCATA